jgi:hypothetical protein
VVEKLLQRVAWYALEDAHEEPFKSKCHSVIDSLIEFVGVTLECFGISSNLHDEIRDEWIFLHPGANFFRGRPNACLAGIAFLLSDPD